MREYYEMPDEVLLTAAMMGDVDACSERLIREIMAVDEVRRKSSPITYIGSLHVF
jgi:hypothetical protein